MCVYEHMCTCVFYICVHTYVYYVYVYRHAFVCVCVYDRIWGENENWGSEMKSTLFVVHTHTGGGKQAQQKRLALVLGGTEQCEPLKMD